MSEKNFSNAAQQYLARRVAGTKAQCLPEADRPTSIEDALTVHQEMIKQRSDTVGGWKCLLPLAEDKFIVAPIFSNTVQSGEQCHMIKDKNVALDAALTNRHSRISFSLLSSSSAATHRSSANVTMTSLHWI